MHLAYSSSNIDQKKPGLLDRYSPLGEIFHYLGAPFSFQMPYKWIRKSDRENWGELNLFSLILNL